MIERPGLKDALRPFGLGIMIARRIGSKASAAAAAQDVDYLRHVRDERLLIDRLQKEKASFSQNPTLYRAWAHELLDVLMEKAPDVDPAQHIVGVASIGIESGVADARLAADVTYELGDEVGAKLSSFPPRGTEI